jgi:HD-like signal output (HDOD) protein
MKKRILFVDDEAALLAGLRGRLHGQRSAWDMVFVESGAAAIATMEITQFDVIVSDMRMPGMDGAQLLSIVSERWPGVVRIVLSGYAEQDLILRLVPVAHRYLSKPCDAQTLQRVIEDSLQVQELLASPALRSLAGRVRTLPLLPDTMRDLRAAMLDEHTTVADVTRIVTSDLVLAAKLLQVANSAFFRLARPIIDIEQAIVYLGFGVIRNLAFSPDVFTDWDFAHLPPGFDPVAMQRHARFVSATAGCLADGSPLVREARLAGLMHDIGLLLLAHGCSEQLECTAAFAETTKASLAEAERECIGATHSAVGAYLLGIWGLPFSVVEAVASHQHVGDRAAQSELARVLALAHRLAPCTDCRYDQIDDPLVGDDCADTGVRGLSISQARALVAATLQPELD